MANLDGPLSYTCSPKSNPDKACFLFTTERVVCVPADVSPRLPSLELARVAGFPLPRGHALLRVPAAHAHLSARGAARGRVRAAVWPAVQRAVRSARRPGHAASAARVPERHRVLAHVLPRAQLPQHGQHKHRGKRAHRLRPGACGFFAGVRVFEQRKEVGVCVRGVGGPA